MFNLLTDRWLPVLRRSSGACLIAPPELTEALEDDPVVASIGRAPISASRPLSC